MFLKRMLRNKKGAALVEYGLLVAGVALVAAAAVAIFGTKTNDLISSIASVLPGAHAEDNGPIESGRLLETTKDAANNNALELDIERIETREGTDRLGDNIGVPIELLILEPTEDL